MNAVPRGLDPYNSRVVSPKGGHSLSSLRQCNSRASDCAALGFYCIMSHYVSAFNGFKNAHSDTGLHCMVHYISAVNVSTTVQSGTGLHCSHYVSSVNVSTAVQAGTCLHCSHYVSAISRSSNIHNGTGLHCGPVFHLSTGDRCRNAQWHRLTLWAYVPAVDRR